MARGAGGRLNRTHASFLNSLAGPKKKKEEGEKRKYWWWEGRVAGLEGEGGVGGSFFNASLILNATANAEKKIAQFITIPSSERACAGARAQ